MRGIFKKNLPNIPIHDGLANNIPFDDGFFQIVIAAQAFHWFANIESLREINRVLKKQTDCKNGKSGLALIWNTEDYNASPYMKEIFDLCCKYDYKVPQYYKFEWKHVFENVTESKILFSEMNSKFFKNSEVYLPLSLIWPRIISKSYITTESELEIAKIKQKIEQIVDKYKSYLVKRPNEKELCLQYPYFMELVWFYTKKN